MLVQIEEIGPYANYDAAQEKAIRIRDKIVREIRKINGLWFIIAIKKAGIN